jgi:transposase
MPRPSGSSDAIEYRRKRALALLDKGHSINEVGRLLDCAPSSVMRWRDMRTSLGTAGLRVRYSPGRPARLSKAELGRITRLLLKGAMAHGYSTDIWTTARIAEVIKREFGVSYHRDHVGRLLQSLGWSHQKPERRSVERDEKSIKHWRRHEWPRLKKTPLGWVPTSSLSTNQDS